MSYSKFRLKQSNSIIYYEINNNAIYNELGDPLTLPPEKDISFYEEASKVHGSRKKSNKPTAIRILFGQACNYSCSYCMQKDIGNPEEQKKNTNLDAFIKSIDTYLDLENLERIELWGGEPFLYWNDIMPVMKHLDKAGRHFYISTNGSPLRDKHADFFETLESKITMGISHDGPGQESLRGEDIFDKSSVAKTLQRLDTMYPHVQFSFNTVISLTNYDMFGINKYFRDVAENLNLKNVKLSYTMARIYDETNSQNSADHVISGEDLANFKHTMNSYIDECIKQLKTHGRNKNREFLETNIFDGKGGVLDYAATLKHQVPVTMTTGCGADAEDVLSVDVQGNVRLCPHTSEKFIAGKIDNLKGIRIIQLDLNRKKTHCSDCSVRRLCKSSCPITFPDNVFLQNCRVEKVWNGAIQHKAFELLFGQEVELLEMGIESINAPVNN